MADLRERQLHHFVGYEPTTGLLYWKEGRGNRVAGQSIGWPTSRGYLRFEFMGRTYATHRVAWFLHHGHWPREEIDHINGNPIDNRIVNLRDVQKDVNIQNKYKAHKNNASGLLGVQKSGRRGKPWRATIGVGKTHKTLGYFVSREEAQEVYLAAKKRLHSVAMQRG